jgi:signal transduction histidine kinase
MLKRARLILTPIASVFHSIRFRLAIWSALILGVVLVFFSGFVFTRQARDLRDVTVSRLTIRLDQLEAFYRLVSIQSASDAIVPFPDVMPNGTALLQENEALVLVGADGTIIQDAGPINAADLSSLVDAGKRLSQTSDLASLQLEGKFPIQKSNPQEYIFLLAPVTFHRQIVGLLFFGRPFDPDGQLPRLMITLTLASLGMVLFAMLGGYFLAWRALRPVQVITRTARAIGETDLSQRLNLNSQDELGELAGTFDQMLERLQAAFNRQRQFTADASHELRTPLTIVGLETSHALANKRSAQEYDRTLRVIQSENDYMAHLVNDLLTLARMDAGQTGLKLEEVDLSDVSLEAVERLAPLAARKKVELRTGELPELLVMGDRQFLLQMVTNLVENAIKYSTGEQSQVHVETGQREGLAWLQVADNGLGIPAEHLPHLFERFYRVDKARARDSVDGEEASQADGETPGSGLGLAIVKWIVQAHGGQVTVQSELGKGTTFEATLPLMPSEEKKS